MSEAMHDPAGSRAGADAIIALTASVERLGDLFRRRLLDDRDKRRLIERLCDDLDGAREGRAADVMLPLVRGIFLVVDRLDRVGDEQPIAVSVRDELLEVLARQGIDEVATRGPVDPRFHEVSARVGDGGGSMVVERVERRGFRMGERLLRPAAVVARSQP